MAKAGRENQKSFLLYASNVMRDALLKNYGVETMMKMNLGRQDFTMEKFAPFIHAGNCIRVSCFIVMSERYSDIVAAVPIQ